MPKYCSLSLALFFLWLKFGLCIVYYISPSPGDTQCPMNRCHSLTEINAYKLQSNTTLILLQGDHHLNNVLYVANISMLELISSTNESVPVINCAQQANLTIFNISDVQIIGLEFRCGGNRIEAVNQFILKNSSFYGHAGSPGTFLETVATNAHIVNSFFMFGTVGNFHQQVDILKYIHIMLSFRTNLRKIRVGGAIITTNSNLTVKHSHFEGNSAQIGGAIFSEANSNVIINNCTIINNGATGCSVCLAGAMFIDSGCTTVVENSIVANNTALSGGGAFFTFQATLSVQHSVIHSNTANYGGAMTAVRNSTLVVRDCQLYNNMAAVFGGVIQVYASYGFIDGSTFHNNTAASNGGALASQKGSIIDVEYCTFVNNSVGDGASGGLMLIEYNSTINMCDSLCIKNKALFMGGVAYIQHSSAFTSKNCTFIANIAKNDGGVIQVQDRSNASLDSCMRTFSNNRAGIYGGVIHVERESALITDNCKFYGNSAVEEGGVIDIHTSGVIAIYNSFFANNVGEDDGGVVSSFGMVVLRVYNSTFRNNSAIDDGGVIYVRQANSVTIDDSTFTHNSAHQGGVITVTATFQNSTTTLTNCTMNYNTADFGGVIASLTGGIVVISGSMLNFNRGSSEGGVAYAFQSGGMFVDNSSFISNTGGTGAVVAAFRNVSIRIAASTFMNNSASNDGGAIYVFSDSAVVIGNCIFIDNIADDGGVLYARQSSSATIHRSNLTHNRATIGGVMRVRESSSAIVSDSRFMHNIAVNEGGVGYIYRNSTITVSGSTFENNTGDFGGTFVAFQGSSLTTCSCLFINNSANFGGVARIYQSSTFNVSRSNFTLNRAQEAGGVAFMQKDSNFYTDYSNFDFNEAYYGAVMYADHDGFITVSNSQFVNNTAGDSGGVISAYSNTMITINYGYFSHNRGTLDGGVMRLSENSTVIIRNSIFRNNTAGRDGGVFYGIESSYIAAENSSFVSDTVDDDGGVVFTQTNCSVSLARCNFDSNTATDNGGVIFMFDSSILSISDSNFSLNEAGDSGGVVYGITACIIRIDASRFSNSTAKASGGVVHVEEESKISINNSIFSYNRAGSEGGAVSVHVGGIVNVSNTNFSFNIASDKGGALAIDKSSVAVDGKYSKTFFLRSMIVNNSASKGGGVYLLDSHFYFRIYTNITDNHATERGGGIHAVNSFVIVQKELQFVNNNAEYGGGISLEKKTKLYVVSISNSTEPLLTFTSNRAKYGGAVYVADETNPLLCSSLSSWAYSTDSECFFQSLSLNRNTLSTQTMHFSDNFASISGSNLYGGLLDRCTIVNLPTDGAKLTTGANNFKKLSGIIELDTVASDPVRICFCRGGEPDCKYNPSPIEVKRGETIDIRIVAVDHVSHIVNGATVHASLNSTVGSLGEGQETQRTQEGCTELSYDLLSIHHSEQLLLYAVGPCRNRGISQVSVVIQILPCTCLIGFARSERDATHCSCNCDPKLSSYVTECYPSEGSFVRSGNFWVTYVNTTFNDGDYLIYPNCPLDYCHPPGKLVTVNLNSPNGADAQCVGHRSGTLCGICQPGFSLSIGSSHCIKCSKNWPVVLAVILVASVIAGIALVILLLVLNLTVAVGTLNSIIFFANIVGANSSAFFLTSDITFASVFISWLNLDIGIDSCFYEGMDTYTKTWLQLAFPAYIIFIVTIVMYFSSWSAKFSNLIGRKNPVATLATLLLFSYSKLLQTTISAFSSATLEVPSQSGVMSIRVWLPDATVHYLNGKHIPLFIVVILIFLAGLAYTFLLFTWQWFLRSPRTRIFSWTRYQKLNIFMETYHVPYTPRHRYWTGLLLIVRAILFIVSAINFSGDPRVTLLSTIIIVSLVIFYKAFFNIRIYKNWLINAMETFTYLNIVILATFTWYAFDANGNQEAVVRISIGIVFIMLLFVIAYHVYRYSNIPQFNKLRQSVFCEKLSKKLYSEVERTPETLADKNTHELLRAIDHNPQEETTYSVLDTLELQNCNHSQHCTSEGAIARSSMPNTRLSTKTAVTSVVSKCSSGSTEMPKSNPNVTEINHNTI